MENYTLLTSNGEVFLDSNGLTFTTSSGAVKATASITLSHISDVDAVYTYYILASSKPAAPTVYPPSGEWTLTEPEYVNGSTTTLYFVDVTVFSNGDISYSEVSKSSSYEAAKAAYNKALTAESTAEGAASAAEDAKNENDEMYAEIQILKGSVVTVAEDENGKCTFTQSGAGLSIEFNPRATTEAIADISEDIDEVNKGLANTNDNISSVEDKVNKLDTKTAWINSSFRDNKPVLELGSSESDFSVEITNEAIDFKEKGDVVAYINNKALNITQAIIEDEIQIGDELDANTQYSSFVWKIRPNGNMGIVWRGHDN